MTLGARYGRVLSRERIRRSGVVETGRRFPPVERVTTFALGAEGSSMQVGVTRRAFRFEPQPALRGRTPSNLGRHA